MRPIPVAGSTLGTWLAQCALLACVNTCHERAISVKGWGGRVGRACVGLGAGALHWVGAARVLVHKLVTKRLCAELRVVALCRVLFIVLKL